MQVDGKEIKPNSRTYVSMKVTRDLNGADISIPVHVIAGAKAGPTLALVTLLHGSEWLSSEVVRRVVEKTPSEDLTGTLIAVPVANPVALNYLRRITQDECDAPDMNRVFPGQYNWIGDQLASKLTREVLAKSDYLVHIDFGMWAHIWGYVGTGADYPNAEVVKKCEAMAKAFGYPCIKREDVMSVYPGPGSIVGYFGGILGRPSILVEIGGAGLDEAMEEKWINTNVAGVENVMKHLKMLKGEPRLLEKYLFFEKTWRVDPSIAGILVPKIPVDSLMREVKKGELLGVVVSPYSFEVLEELRSPGNGIVFYCVRMYPARPGDYGFGVVDWEDKHTQWISAH